MEVMEIVLLAVGAVVFILSFIIPAKKENSEEVLGLAKEDCVYIGDSEVDIQTAKNLGVKCLSVLWGFRDQETLQAVGGKYFGYR